MVDIRVGDIGTQFLFTVRNSSDSSLINISNYSNRTVTFIKPNGDQITVSGTLYTDGTDGKLFYNSVSGNIDQIGFWRARVTLSSSGNLFNTDYYRFTVNPLD